MLTIGLTGGIGSGKSTVTKFLAALGAPIIDADKVGHAIYAPGGPAYNDMLGAFGHEIVGPDGTIDRKKLGPIVFADPEALKRLNSIVHPKMFTRMREMVQQLRGEGVRDPVLVEAAILIEANWQPLFDEIWLVVASRERVIERIERDRTRADRSAHPRATPGRRAPEAFDPPDYQRRCLRRTARKSHPPLARGARSQYRCLNKNSGAGVSPVDRCANGLGFAPSLNHGVAVPKKTSALAE